MSIEAASPARYRKITGLGLGTGMDGTLIKAWIEVGRQRVGTAGTFTHRPASWQGKPCHRAMKISGHKDPRTMTTPATAWTQRRLRGGRVPGLGAEAS